MRGRLGTVLQQAGMKAAAARACAALIVSPYDGALIQARVVGRFRRSSEPLWQAVPDWFDAHERTPETA